MLGDSDHIHILLVEYDALKEECFLRIKSRFAIMGYGGVVTAFLIAQSAILPWFRCVIAVVAGVALIAVWFRFGQLVAKCQRRLAEIEMRVNSLAGDTLLTWYSLIVPQVFFHRAHSAAIWRFVRRSLLVIRTALRWSPEAAPRSPATKEQADIHEEESHR